LLLPDRDRIFGSGFTEQVEELGIEEVLAAPGVPQQRAYIERVIGTIRRECLDHVIVFNEASLCRHLSRSGTNVAPLAASGLLDVFRRNP
jgi:transposase InsO family protein